MSNGKYKGIEITESVNQDAIDAQINDYKQYSKAAFSFGFDDALEKRPDIVEEKERKCGSIHQDDDGLSLLMHTDEYLINPD